MNGSWTSSSNPHDRERVRPKRPVHILLVDDDLVDVMAAKRAFHSSKIANPVTVARDGIEALALLRGDGVAPIPEPYMILLDLNMPRMNGVEFLQALRADPRHGQAIVFVLTTSATNEDLQAAYAWCVAGYITKANAGHDFVNVVKLLEAYWLIVEFP